MGWCRQKFSRKNQAIWAKNEPQKMASLTAGGTCSCITVQYTKIHYTVVVCTTQCNTLRIQLEGSPSTCVQLCSNVHATWLLVGSYLIGDI